MTTKQTQRLKAQVMAAIERDEPQTPRQKILDEASERTSTEVTTHFKNVAALWTAYWRAKFPGMVNFTAHDVVMFNALQKVAHVSVNPNDHTSTVDIAGYIAYLGDVQEEFTKYMQPGFADNKTDSMSAMGLGKDTEGMIKDQQMKGTLRR